MNVAKQLSSRHHLLKIHYISRSIGTSYKISEIQSTKQSLCTWMIEFGVEEADCPVQSADHNSNSPLG